MQYVDAVVLGGGPAGVAAALTLVNRGRSVVLLERRSSFQSKFGEWLPPSALQHLSVLGLTKLLNWQTHLPSNIIRSSWGNDSLQVQDLSFHPFGNGWQINRIAFEKALLTRAQQAGVLIKMGTSLSSSNFKQDNMWHIHTSSDQSIKTAFVIDATGRAAHFAKRFGAVRHNLDRLVALSVYVDQIPADLDEGLLIESHPSGWWYLTRIPESKSVITFLTDWDIIPSGRENQRKFWQQALSETKHIKNRSDLPNPANVNTTSASTSRLNNPVGNGWIAVGDAAMTYDPLSSLGISNALETGRLGALSVHGALAGDYSVFDAYSRVIQKRIEEADRRKIAYYTLERRWPTMPFWHRRVASNLAT